jgi:hypothetical protein
VKQLVAFSLLALAACKTPSVPEPVVRTVTVNVPVAMPCIPQNYSRTRPQYADEDSALKAAVDAAERYMLLWAGREQRKAREAENEAVIAGCPSDGSN